MPKPGDRYFRPLDASTWRVMSAAPTFVTLRSEEGGVLWHVTLEDLAAKLRPIEERPS